MASAVSSLSSIGWSAFAESSEAAIAVQELGLVWPGTEPTASQKLEKIGFKQICEKVGAPTPPFIILADEGTSKKLTDPKVCLSRYRYSLVIHSLPYK